MNEQTERRDPPSSVLQRIDLLRVRLQPSIALNVLQTWWRAQSRAPHPPSAEPRQAVPLETHPTSSHPLVVERCTEQSRAQSRTCYLSSEAEVAVGLVSASQTALCGWMSHSRVTLTRSNSGSGSVIYSLPLITLKIPLHTRCPQTPFFFLPFLFFFSFLNLFNKTKSKAKYQKHHIGLTNCNITS